MAIFGSSPNAMINFQPMPAISNASPAWLSQIQNMAANFHPYQPPNSGQQLFNQGMGLLQYMQRPQMQQPQMQPQMGWGNYQPNLVGQNMPGFNFHPMAQQAFNKPAATNGSGW